MLRCFNSVATETSIIRCVFDPILDRGGKNAPPGRYFEKKLTHLGPKARSGSDFYFILVLQVLAKIVGQIGVVIRKYLDFVEGSSQFSIQISENSGKRWK